MCVGELGEFAMSNKEKDFKNILCISIFLMMIVGAIIPKNTVIAATSTGTYAEGDNISLGKMDGVVLEWTILSYDSTTGQALVVSRKTLDTTTVSTYRAAVNKYYIDAGTMPRFVMWKDNYWRGWCNQIFYTNCFNDIEKEMIVQTTLTATDAQASLMNFYHDTTLDAYYLENGSKNAFNMQTYNMQCDSDDYVFFLSTDEYTEYQDVLEFTTYGLWPLRTNAYDDPAKNLFVNDCTELIQRDYYYTGGGVRPAMYLQLTEVEEEEEEEEDETASTDDEDTTTETASTTTATTVSTKSYANNATNVGDIMLPDDSEYTMSRGSTAQVAINLAYLNSTDKNYTVTYKSSNASVFTVDSSGVITAVGNGSATLTVKMKKSNGKTYTLSCRINVE